MGEDICDISNRNTGSYPAQKDMTTRQGKLIQGTHKQLTKKGTQIDN